MDALIINESNVVIFTDGSHDSDRVLLMITGTIVTATNCLFCLGSIYMLRYLEVFVYTMFSFI